MHYTLVVFSATEDSSLRTWSQDIALFRCICHIYIIYVCIALFYYANIENSLKQSIIIKYPHEEILCIVLYEV